MAKPRPLIGLAAGVVAGLVASAAMAAFQATAEPLIEDSGSGDDDPATLKAADKASEIMTGDKVPEPYRQASGQVVHYVVGAALGGIYGLLTEYHEGTRAGFGSAYGVAISALLDEGAVPAAGLSPAPDETPASQHLYGVASHLVFGVVLEGVRALIAGRR
jgi:putative membrane protein